MELILTKYLIDIVKAVEAEEYEGAKVQLVTYSVLAGSADEAVQRFFHDEAGVVMYEGDIVDGIFIGIQAASDQPIDVGSNDARHLPV